MPSGWMPDIQKTGYPARVPIDDTDLYFFLSTLPPTVADVGLDPEPQRHHRISDTKHNAIGIYWITEWVKDE